VFSSGDVFGYLALAFVSASACLPVKAVARAWCGPHNLLFEIGHK